MKLLNKIKIINWHYFFNETINVEQIVFLTGLNASGKSTLIDALQVILLGDTTGRQFNKAAQEKSKRTLKGYLRGELGDNVDGGFNYLRNGRFTSYIALEFKDDVKESSFVLGCVFDVFEDGSEEHRFFFLNDKMPENEFIGDNKVPMEYKTLNSFFAQNYAHKYEFFDSNRQYQEKLKKEFGGLKDKYFSLFKKAVSFSPITDIETFITEYVTETQLAIDITPMQDNIIQYKKLEDEALVMKRRVERLEEIALNYGKYYAERDNMRLYEYIIERATLKTEKVRLDSYYKDIENANNRLKEIDAEIIDIEENIEKLNKNKMRLIADNANNDTYRLTDELKEQEKETQNKIFELKNLGMQVRSNLQSYLMGFIQASQNIVDFANDIEKKNIDDSITDQYQTLVKTASEALNKSLMLRDSQLNDIKQLNANSLSSWRDSLAAFKAASSSLSGILSRKMHEDDKKVALLKQQELDLRQGGKPYDRVLIQIKTQLQNELSTRHNSDIKVDFFADLIDIKTHLWTNAIEGFLASNRFNLFVDGRYYIEAYAIMRHLLDEYRFYGMTIVDQDKIIERNFEHEKGSIAEEIITTHQGAKAYATFLLGRLAKCRTIEEARNSGNGITPECDIYRNFSLGKINPRNYAVTLIGRQASKGSLEGKKAEIENAANNVEIVQTLYGLLNRTNALEMINTNEITSTTEQINSLSKLSAFEDNLVYIKEELTKHDLTQVEGIQRRIDLLDADIKQIGEERALLFEEKGKLKTQIDGLNKDRIPEAIRVVSERETKLVESYDPFFIDEKANPLFTSLEAQNMTALEINSEYRVKFGHSQYIVNSIFSALVKLRKDYVNDYRLTYEVNGEDNTVYEDEYHEMKDVKLPSYEVKIRDAYDKAVRQFKDDFISKLRSSIESVEDQIAELNVALSASTFGNDSYMFTVKPSAIYRQYYDMIKDDLLLKTGENDNEFFEKYDDVMKNLFAQIVLAGDGDKNAAVLANVEKFTDYRNYLSFDLIVKDKSGNEQRLSKMLTKKSGGETQTPFYIAVLASFAQLYRVNDPSELSNSARIIIFDEAFSKMDGGRIKESIRLLRKMGLQAIVSAPSDKIADISELVDETLVVLRGKNQSHVSVYAREDNITE